MQSFPYSALQIAFNRLGALFSLFGLLGYLLLGISSPAIAGPDFTSDLVKQTPIEVQVSLSNTGDELKFFPENIEFSAGRRYKLVLTNPSHGKHYFTAKDFADNIWSQKVEAGKVEIKGAIHELELKPGAKVEWVFVPIKPGTYELHCSIPGHTEAGMVGKLAIAVAS